MTWHPDCPVWWCSKPLADHKWLSDRPAVCVSKRLHSADVGLVDVLQLENRDGTWAPATIAIRVDEVDVEGARQMAQDLSAAALLLERIKRRCTG